jgi:serine/threonine protein kinase
MAPETAEGRSQPASDIYSIGLVLFEALTGTLPFEHLAVPIGLPEDQHEAWLFEQKGRMVVPAPSSRNPAVPPNVDALILKCLYQNPDDRINNGRALLRALDVIDAPSIVPGQAAWETGQLQSRAGNQATATETWEKGLTTPGISLEQKVRLMQCLGEAAEQAGDRARAVGWFGKIWEEARNSGALLTQAADRIKLLEKIIRLHEQLGNGFEAARIRRDLKPYQLNR